MKKVKVSPSILSADFANMGEAIQKTEKWGANYIHCDVMDGVFVNNITFGMPMIKAIKKYTSLPLDVHLMIVSPEKYVDRFVDAGANIITFHPNVCENVVETLRRIRARGVKAGLVVNPDVPISSIAKYIDEIDILLLMSVFPGFGGQKFIESVFDKIHEAKALIGNRDIELEIDGGITVENVEKVTNAGVNVVVAGSAVYNVEDPKEAIKLLKR